MAREFFFTVEYPGVETKISSRIELTEGSGVTLHFFRYGYFLKNSPIDLKVDYYPYILYKNEKLRKPYLDKQLGKIAENNFYSRINARDEHLQKNEKNSSSKKNQKEDYLKEIQKINPEEVSILYYEEVETVMRKCVKQEDVEIENPFSILDNFYVARTFLDAGYLYIFGKNDKNFFREYKVDEYGEYYPIIWREGNDRDYREPNWKPSKVIVPPDEYYFAFSRVQLSLKYIQKLRSNEEELSKRTQLINCGLRVNDPKASDEVVDPTYVSVVCDPQHPLLYSFLTLSQMAFNAAKNNSPNRFETVTIIVNTYQVYDDICITLKDPIGCDIDLSLVLGEKINDLKALVASLPTGKSPENIKKEWRIQQEELLQPQEQQPEQQEDSTLLTDVKEPPGFSTIFINALSVYHFVYGNDKNKEKYGDTVNRKMIEDLLAVNERKALRKEIIKYRRDLAYFIYTYDYTQHFHDFAVKNIPNVVEGSCYCAAHLKLACTTFADIDDHLYLRNEELYNDTDKMCLDETKRFLDSIFNRKPIKCVDYDECIAKLQKERQLNIVDLLTIPIHLEEFNSTDKNLQGAILTTDLVNKTAFLINNSLDLYIRTSIAEIEKKALTFSFIKRIKFEGEEFFKLTKKQLYKVLRDNGIDLKKTNLKILMEEVDGKYVFYPKNDDVDFIDIKKKNRKTRTKTSTEVQRKVTIDVEVETKPATRTREQVKGAEELFNHPLFTRALVILQLFNIAGALYQLGKDTSMKNGMNALGVATDLITAYINVYRANLITLKAEKKIIEQVGKHIDTLSKISNGISAVYCGLEVWDAYKVGDNDAAKAFSVSGIAFASLALVEMTFGLSILIGIIAIGAYTLGNWLKDDNFKIYFNNSWFRVLNEKDTNKFQKHPKEEVWQYLSRIYKYRNYLMTDKEITLPWRDNIHLCYQYFLDMFNNIEIIAEEALDDIYERTRFEKNTRPVYYFGNAMQIIFIIPFLYFDQVLKSVEQLEYQMFIVNKEANKIIEVFKWDTKDILELKKALHGEERIQTIELTINIPDWIKNKYGKKESSALDFLLVFRLKIENDYFPYNYMKEARFLGVFLPIYTHRDYDYKPINGYYKLPIEAPFKQQKIGSLKEIKQWVLNH